MNKYKFSQQLIKFIIIAFVILIPTFVFAQPGFDDEVLDTPIDGGLSLLVIAGAGYGAKKLKERKKNTKQ